MKNFKLNDYNHSAVEINRAVAFLAILCAARYFRACRGEGEERERQLSRMNRLYDGFATDAPAALPRFDRILDAVIDREETARAA